jgi:4,5-DOPA dioxygenase extradiol
MNTVNRMPVLFVGHGNPMNSLEQNAFTRAWAQIGATIPRPRAILCVSAHWFIDGVAVTSSAQPSTLHDFRGFPRELFDVAYPAPGSPELAERVAELLTRHPVHRDTSWGLDHGTWSVLVHMYPGADVPVVQLSLDSARDATGHFALARQLGSLRDEGVLVMGSGNLVHNLARYAWNRPVDPAYDWATRFEQRARQQIERLEFEPLSRLEAWGADAALAVPTPEHYLPLLYVLAQYRTGDTVTFPVQGFEGRSISMLAVQVG